MRLCHQGSKYDEKMKVPEINRKIRKDLKNEFPDWEFKVSKHGYNRVDVEILKMPFNPYNINILMLFTEEKEAMRSLRRFNDRYNAELEKIKKTIKEYQKAERDDVSGYERENYYINIGLADGIDFYLFKHIENYDGHDLEELEAIVLEYLAPYLTKREDKAKTAVKAETEPKTEKIDSGKTAETAPNDESAEPVYLIQTEQPEKLEEAKKDAENLLIQALEAVKGSNDFKTIESALSGLIPDINKLILEKNTVKDEYLISNVKFSELEETNRYKYGPDRNILLVVFKNVKKGGKLLIVEDTATKTYKYIGNDNKYAFALARQLADVLKNSKN